MLEGKLSREFATSSDVAPRRMTGRIPPKQKMFSYVYILRLSNGDLYKGVTNDLRRRIDEHTNGKVESTKHYRPFVFVGYEAYRTESDALRREKFLKTTEGGRLLKQQYRDILNSVGDVAERSKAAPC